MNEPFIIGITGGSGSGKTSFIRELRQLFTEEQLCILSQDDFYKPRDKQEADATGVKNFDLPHSIYKKAFREALLKLKSGELVMQQEYTFNNTLATPRQLVFRPAPVIVVEGLFVFHYKKIRRMLDLKVFLHAKENLKVIRRIRRDQLERNYPIDDVLYRYQNHVLPTFERYIKPYMEEADIIINNNENFSMGLHVVSGFIRQRLLMTGLEGENLLPPEIMAK